jgi:hypothetical protein
MPRPNNDKSGKRQRVIFSLPRDLVADIRRYATLLHGGNKSVFVADAVRSYIDHVDKVRHTAKLRQAYAASAAASRAIACYWDPLSAEAWTELDERKGKGH